MKVVFLGTPQVAVATLDALKRSNHQLLAVITAPDRAKGRGMNVAAPPVKTRALEYGFPVLQPPGLKEAAVQSQLAELGADVFVVAAYGVILPEKVLDTPPLGCVNLHFSLLPEFRGAAPVQWALINGREKTGVTIMQIEAGLDSGPILSQDTEPIHPDDTGGSLSQRLAMRGADLMVDTLDRLERREITPEPQDEALATYAPKISPDDARIDWSQPAEEIERRVRAFDPAPGAWTMFDDKRLKVWRVEVVDEDLRLVEVQPEGKRRMTADEFFRGRGSVSRIQLQ